MEEKAASLEITVISAEELRIDNRPIKKNAFVAVGTGEEKWRSTSVDRDGGSYPSWNEKLEVELPPHARSIAVQVQCKTAVGIKTVGSAEVPLSDITEGYVPARHLHFLSYRLRERDGRRNGIINLCVRMVGPTHPLRSNRWMGSSSSASSSVCKGSGVVIGVPVAWRGESKSMQF
ncbi:hypothetical protein MRB53_003206 [Persea americana]|uniref:Uncharacterized protein n=1 Tax=Persea americana TaxID=3435 RepID=A0ACC2MWY6_PERAE|nr:hypothetical protein MRB53_003206 [Persea americana]